MVAGFTHYHLRERKKDKAKEAGEKRVLSG